MTKERFLIIASPHHGYAHQVFENMFTDVLIYSDALRRKLTQDDVAMFDGGTDVDASFYNEKRHPYADSPAKERDAWEREVFRAMQGVGAGCIGVCRGSQFLTAMSGGKLIQHVTKHGGPHEMETYDGKTLVVTSTHHQQMWPNEVHHDLLGWTSNDAQSFCEYGKDFDCDKQPEIVWYPDTRSLCIQGHPEYMRADAPFYQYSRQLVEKFLFKEKV